MRGSSGNVYRDGACAGKLTGSIRSASTRRQNGCRTARATREAYWRSLIRTGVLSHAYAEHAKLLPPSPIIPTTLTPVSSEGRAETQAERMACWLIDSDESITASSIDLTSGGLTEVDIMQFTVKRTAAKQFFMTTAVDHPPQLHHHDFVRQTQCRQAMRDHDRCPTANEFL